MNSIWHGIDPREAEAKLRSLKRRLCDLDDALENQAAMLGAHPNSFAFKLDMEGLMQKQSDLQDELATLLRHRITDASNVGEHAPKSAQ